MTEESYSLDELFGRPSRELELSICGSCWDFRNNTVDMHRCRAKEDDCVDGKDCPDYIEHCDCPCRERRHSDLDTIDLDHDRGIRDLTDPFHPNGGDTR
jgi:hypothetical protein